MRGLGRSFLEVGAYFKHGGQWARRVVLQHCPVTGKPHIEASLGRPRKTSALEDCDILAMAKNSGQSRPRISDEPSEMQEALQSLHRLSGIGYVNGVDEK